MYLKVFNFHLSLNKNSKTYILIKSLIAKCITVGVGFKQNLDFPIRPHRGVGSILEGTYEFNATDNLIGNVIFQYPLLVRS